MKKIYDLPVSILMALPLILLSLPTLGADVAKIGSSSISTSEYQQAIALLGEKGVKIKNDPKRKRAYLDYMMGAKILAEAAIAEGLDKSEDFERRQKEAREQILAATYLERYLKNRSSDAAMRKYFEVHADEFRGRKAKIAQIFTRDHAKAETYLVEVLKPETHFEDYATQNSEDKTIDLGWIEYGTMAKDFEDAVYATPKGQVHPQVIKSDLGYHVVKVYDLDPGIYVSYDEVKKGVKARFEQDVLLDAIGAAKQKIKVSVDEAALRRIN